VPRRSCRRRSENPSLVATLRNLSVTSLGLRSLLEGDALVAALEVERPARIAKIESPDAV
jgi:hypothetical protein